MIAARWKPISKHCRNPKTRVEPGYLIKSLGMQEFARANLGNVPVFPIHGHTFIFRISASEIFPPNSFNSRNAFLGTRASVP